MNKKELKMVLEKHRSIDFPDTNTDVGAEIKPEIVMLDADVYGEASSIVAGNRDEIKDLGGYKEELVRLRKVSEENGLSQVLTYLGSIENILEFCSTQDDPIRSDPWWKIW